MSPVPVQDDPLVPEENAGDPLELLQENGPWVYELFAVLIHSGSALGGHYYAHIKSLGDDGGWRLVRLFFVGCCLFLDCARRVK